MDFEKLCGEELTAHNNSLNDVAYADLLVNTAYYRLVNIEANCNEKNIQDRKELLEIIYMDVYSWRNMCIKMEECARAELMNKMVENDFTIEDWMTANRQRMEVLMQEDAGRG